MAFPQFSSLPQELQLQVWDSLTTGPSMHIFDVCFPSAQGSARVDKAFGPREAMDEDTQKRYDNFANTAFLDCLDTSAEADRRTRVARYPFDPSMYRLTSSLAAVNRSAAARAHRAGGPFGAGNSVYLPGRNRTVRYPNSDVLMLRFGDGGVASSEVAARLFPTAEDVADAWRFSSLSEVLESQWSSSMALTLERAHKVALDVAEAWLPGQGGSEMVFEETTYLACTLQKDLEVLYLVDHCAGRCSGCGRAGLRAARLGARGELFNGLHYQDGGDGERPGDVVAGVSKRYVEVFDLEGLGWSDGHPAYVFARMVDEAIRMQQWSSDRVTFRGVRVLVVEEEELAGRETKMSVDCKAESPIAFSADMLDQMSALLLPALAGSGLTNAEAGEK